MNDTPEETGGRPTLALFYTELGKMREELSRGLSSFEERITGRLQAMADAQSAQAMKNAHEIGVLTTRVEAQQVALEKLGDGLAIAHDARNRVAAIERARAEEAAAMREGRGNRWQLVAVIAGSVVLVAMDHIWSLIQAGAVHP